MKLYTDWRRIRNKCARGLSIVQNIIYPPTCVLCGEFGYCNMDLCRGCHADLPYNKFPCPVCGSQLPLQTTDGGLCGECRCKAPPYDSCIIPLRYTGTVLYLIKGLKFNGHLNYARILGELLAVTVAATWDNNQCATYGNVTRPERIIPVPLHSTRLRERGFNQSHEIACSIAKHLDIPIDTTCVRVRATPPQTTLTAEKRRSNLQGAFAMTGKLPTCVAVVDDVVTTGSTIHEIAKTLKIGGVQRVEIWAVAKTGN